MVSIQTMELLRLAFDSSRGPGRPPGVVFTFNNEQEVLQEFCLSLLDSWKLEVNETP